MFGQIYRKLEKELQEKKRKMEAIIEKSNQAYEERDQAIEQMAQLKRQADLEQEEFRRRWERLGSAITDNRKKLMDLQVAKAEAEREESREEKVRGHARRDALLWQQHAAGAPRSRDDSARRPARPQNKAKNAARANWKVSEAKVAHNQNLDKAQTYSDVFEKIKEETGCQDVEELVSKFGASQAQVAQPHIHTAEELMTQFGDTEPCAGGIRREAMTLWVIR